MRILLFATVLALAGCVSTPQTRDEFKLMVQDHPRLAMVGSHTANRRFEDVIGSLERKWQECYGLQRTMTRTQGGMTTMRVRDTFHPQLSKVSDSVAEMTLRMTTEGMIMLNKVPEGGEYIVALDIERVARNRTKLTWYSGSMGGWKEGWERNKQWSEGKDVACEA
jgi:hypothetical protein